MFKKWIKNKTYLKTESNLWSIILLQPTACSHVSIHESLEKQTELDWMRNSSVNRRLLIAWSFKPRAEAVFFLVYEEKKSIEGIWISRIWISVLSVNLVSSKCSFCNCELQYSDANTRGQLRLKFYSASIWL